MKVTYQAPQFAIGSVGSLNTFHGKEFVKESILTTSMEVSVTSLEPGEKSLYHIHHHNEELYIILSGQGIIRLDDHDHAISEGSIIRVAPGVARGLMNTGQSLLTFICVQARDGSLEGYTLSDGCLAKSKP